MRQLVTRPWILVVAGLALVGVIAGSVGAQESLDDLRDERDDVIEDRTDTEAAADALTLEVDEAEAELRRLDRIATQAREDAVAARTAADAAAAAAAASSTSADLAGAELGSLERRAAFLAVELYLGNTDRRALEGVLRGELFADATVDAVIGTVIGDNNAFADEVDSALTVLSERRDEAADLTTIAQEADDAAVRALVVAEEAEAEHLAFVLDLQDRLDRTLAEAEALKELDAELADRIRQRELYLASLLPPRSPGRGDVGPPVGIDQTVIVRGFRVHVDVAEDVEAMVAAAEEDGYSFGGGGWRDGATQIELRRAHCGPSEYDIYVRPSNECRPPTARPRASMHERGLALDITNNGVLITRRDDPAYLWLFENAADYGFYNLPSEPWHWSINGR
ncbi:MAG: M15 family metallopeptidase [Actinomycetota bacterium]